MSISSTVKAYASLPLDETTLARLDIIGTRLKSENKKYNLTALTGDEEIALKHFVDCMQLFKAVSFAKKTVLDVGCGGGFPALVIAALEKSASVAALDSSAKKLSFVAETALAAGLDNVSVLCGRAEELVNGRRETFDVAVSRGVSRLNILCELCLPYVKTGGLFIAMKGAAAQEETQEAQTAIRVLGGVLVEIRPTPIPLGGQSHCLVVIEKRFKTSELYPRPYPKMLAKPL